MNYLLMVQSMKDYGIMKNPMGLEKYFGLTVPFMMVSLLMELLKAMAVLDIKMVLYLKAIF